MYKILLFSLSLAFAVVSAKADIKSDFMSMPDTILVNKAKANIIKDTADYLQAEISSALTIEMKKLRQENGDSCICLVKTYKSPEEHSTLIIYSKNWNVIHKQDFSLEDIVDSVKCPRANMLLNPSLISAHLSPSSDTLTIRVSDFMLTDEEKKELEDITLYKTFTWNGKVFSKVE